MNVVKFGVHEINVQSWMFINSPCILIHLKLVVKLDWLEYFPKLKDVGQ